ncbi:MAG: galactose mutarotase [Duncaniella sp.]|nr:galactose mutarotase [Duncaniella sp.]HBI58444.1 galactose-1-epimerase [Porphyromonadaceae bacterium]
MSNLKLVAAAAVSAICLSACSTGTQQPVLTKSGLNPENFAREYDGKKTSLYTLSNANGMEVCVTNFGGRIVSIMAPDRDGNLRDVVLGLDSVAAYFPKNNQTDFGASIGRYANRINQGRIVLDGDTIQLPQNNFGHCLHGGPTGWQYKVYDASQPNDSTVVLTLQSPDGDNNFPGNVTATVTYTLTADNAIDIDYKAETDKKTIVNMTNHSYFNLSGNPDNQITGDILYINAADFTPVDSTYMTTGEILPVKGTPMDFTTPKAVGQDIAVDFEQLKNGNGYDHNWVLSTNGDINTPAATLMSPESGIKMTVYTDEPGIQVYSGNFLDGTITGKQGKVYNQRTGICLETQHYPDSPNKPEWPSVVLEPGQTYSSHCIFKFDVEK